MPTKKSASGQSRRTSPTRFFAPTLISSKVIGISGTHDATLNQTISVSCHTKYGHSERASRSACVFGAFFVERAKSILCKFKTSNSCYTKNNSKYFETRNSFTKLPVTDCKVRCKIENLHNNRCNGNIFKFITSCEKIERNKIEENTDRIEFPGIARINPSIEDKITYCEEYARYQQEQKSLMHKMFF